MTRGPEGRVQDYARDYFKQRGWLTLKQDSGGGVPDFLFISPKGYHLWVEFKRRNRDGLDPLQEAWRRDFMQRLLRSNLLGINIEGPISSRDEVRMLYDKYKEY